MSCSSPKTNAVAYDSYLPPGQVGPGDNENPRACHCETGNNFNSIGAEGGGGGTGISNGCRKQGLRMEMNDVVGVCLARITSQSGVSNSFEGHDLTI